MSKSPVPPSSTPGPRTAQGKANVRFNALRHGLTSRQLMLPHEDAAAFEHLRATLHEDYQPANGTEALLVDHIAEYQWCLQRAGRAHDHLVSERCGGSDAGFADYLASKESDRLHRILRYTTTVERAWLRAIRELRAAQAARRRDEAQEANVAAGQADAELIAYLNAPPPQSVSQNEVPAGAAQPQNRTYDPVTGKRIRPAANAANSAAAVTAPDVAQ